MSDTHCRFFLLFFGVDVSDVAVAAVAVFAIAVAAEGGRGNCRSPSSLVPAVDEVDVVGSDGGVATSRSIHDPSPKSLLICLPGRTHGGGGGGGVYTRHASPQS